MGRIFGRAVLSAALLTVGAGRAWAGEAVAAPDQAYQRVVEEYLNQKTPELQKDLSPQNHELQDLTAAQRADVVYLRQTLAECRPEWWVKCKEKEEFNFRPAAWGRPLRATFDPNSKSNVQMSYVNGDPSLTLKWEGADLDSKQPAEHGFTKGELADLGVWQTIGMAEVWSVVPISAQMNMTDQTKLALQRYLDFGSTATGVYYSMPRSRRWGLWLATAMYLDKYSNLPTVNSRKAVGATFLAEVASHRTKYPSIQLPDSLPDDPVEENLAIHMKNWIEKHGWTLEEDRAIRDSIKALFLANQSGVMQSGRVRLPNGLFIALDSAKDAQYSEARNAWLKNELQGPAK